MDVLEELNKGTKRRPPNPCTSNAQFRMPLFIP